MTERTIVIGTRGSDLALWQAREAARMFTRTSEVKIIKTSGDRFLDIPLQGRVDKGFFTKEIEAQLLAGDIDVAVHSLKDLPTENPKGLSLGAYLRRAACSDLLLVHPDWHDPQAPFYLKSGCQVGATSLRRQCLLKTFAPHVEPGFLRGNVPNRIAKCVQGQYGAIILARAGVERLNLDLDPLRVYELDPKIWLPAPGQGAIAIQIREDDTSMEQEAASINHETTAMAISIERNLLAAYEGGCHTAFGSLAIKSGSTWTVFVGMDNGKGKWIHAKFTGDYPACFNLKPEDLHHFDLADERQSQNLLKPHETP
ncbi:MAG: hydroxymethylbilane synthase [Acidobacteria bacterium]|nr:MAG: hydroxymethylbilane synthase [Acidobacteriota bacterium]PIE91595.1 MAG: hydroxymethylbilane synthase [Acidobacteriota bacterium]